MHSSANLILTLSTALTAALVFGLVTHTLRLSPIVGYLIAGVLVGPFTPGIVANFEMAQQLSEIGVVLLMFGVGLNFHVSELWAVRKAALPGALLGIAAAGSCGFAVASLFGWSSYAGVVFGLAVSVASTVVLLRVLTDLGVLHTRSGHIAVGWLIVEDLFTVLVLVVLPLLVGKASGSWALLSTLGSALLKVSALVALTVLLGKRAIPKLLELVAKTRSRELFTLSVLALALGIAVSAAELFGVSMALGAFLAGTAVGQSEFSSRAASEALPMRDAFAVLFFVAMGMLLRPVEALAVWPVALVTLLLVLLVKPLVALLTLKLLRYPLRSALLIGFSLAQIGEFSFILAALGRQLEVLPEASMQVLVLVSMASITLNPLLLRLVDPLAKLLRASTTERPSIAGRAHAYRTIVVGYGPVGRIVTRVLRENQLDPLVIELNHETVLALSRDGTPAIYGDASQQTILELAGIERAVGLIFSAAGTPPEAVVRLARQLNPNIVVLARATYLQSSAQLGHAGAQVVVTDEAEVAIAMAERLLMNLGATPEQLDRERARVRAELAPR
jgi:CPA2 family monovalent cation:H+ antiporter-2